VQYECKARAEDNAQSMFNRANYAKTSLNKKGA
jgi:hypothetical protein